MRLPDAWLSEVILFDMTLRFADDTGHHRDSLDSILANRRFAREHYGICAVIDSVGDVRDLRARGAWIFDHRFQHLRSGNDRLEIFRCAANNVLLNRGNFLRWHFDAKIAPSNHDSVSGLKNAVQVFNGLGLLELRDDPRFPAVSGNA